VLFRSDFRSGSVSGSAVAWPLGITREIAIFRQLLISSL
jgi:hypothetical protein